MSGQTPAAPFADLVLTGARICTVDDSNPLADGMAVAGGRIAAVGGAEDVRPWVGPRTEVRDMGGAFVLPGLVDVHNHHSLAGRSELFELSFPASAGLDRILDAVHDHAAGLDENAWVIGGSWGSTLVDALGTEGARRRLDRAAGGRPVLLSDDGRHSRWVSSKALELAGIDRDTADPPGGRIMRDPDTGAPNGILLEAAGVAVETVARRATPISAAQLARASRHAIETLHSHGVTAFQDAAVSVEIMRALKQLDDSGRLETWVVSCMLINDPIFGFDPVGPALLEQGQRFRSEHHRPDFVKIFLDGVPPTRTAAFLEPYLPDGAHGHCFRGETALPFEELTATLRDAAAAGLSAKVHCTGDASVRAALDAVAAVRAAGFGTTRFQIAHGQFIHPDDRPQFAELDVSADVSPFLWTPGEIPAAIAKVRPAEQAAQLQPNRTLLDTGALVAGGTDWPVSPSPNIWEGIQGLVTRRDPTGNHRGALWPEQALTLGEAIRVFTRNGADAMGLGDVTGSLSPGKSADFLVLDRDPFQAPVETLATTTARETWFAGRRVFDRDG